MTLADEPLVRAACRAQPASLQFANRTVVRSRQPDLNVTEILSEIQRLARLPLSQAITLPPQAFTSQEYFDWEIANLFQNDWMPVAHVSQIPQPGDFLNLDLLGEPLSVVHGRDGEVRVLSRICPHRAMDIMPAGFHYEGHESVEVKPGQAGCGHARVLMCPYHAWTFDLDGRVRSTPEMQQAESFQGGAWSLKNFRTEVWHGFVFVNLDGGAPPLHERYAEMAKVLAPWLESDLQLAIQIRWDCPFNWKVLAENFMESYHHMGAHAKTLQPTMPARDTWTEQERPGYIRAHLPIKPHLADEMRAQEAKGEFPEGLPVIGSLPDALKREWSLFMGFPLFMLMASQDRLIWYRMEPLAPDRMGLLTTILVPKTTKNRADWSQLHEAETAMLKLFHMEDMEICAAVQRGFYSSGCQRGRLSHLEMPVWLIHRFIAARARGTWPATDTPPASSQRA
jgi:phenylpropionate dioxygenase-like ring-hydroxylating dioxygenase large terminal subunit